MHEFTAAQSGSAIMSDSKGQNTPLELSGGLPSPKTLPD